MSNPKFSACRLDRVLDDAEIPGLPDRYRGKVRDNYDLADGRRVIIATDRLSAFDRHIVSIPCKGQVLTGLARFWFDATADLRANHVIAYPDPNVLVCRRLTILPVEFVVRDYLAGTTGTSIWPMYRDGRREIYGLHFADGMRENQKLPQTIITPTTKAFDAGHDTPLTAAEITERGLLTRRQWDEVSAAALALFARGRALAEERGLILVDTKYEFGVDADGNILLADEVHTPDSSRYWFRDSYPQRFAAGQAPDTFDKDFIRRWVNQRCDPYREPVPPIPPDIVAAAARLYIEVYERITGATFAAAEPETPVLDRIRRNLTAYLA